MLSPLLIIGVGGSGGKTIRAMKDSLRRKLKMRGWEGELPSAWQFLQIDTTYDGLDFEAEMLPREEVCLVVPQGTTFDAVKEKLENLGNNTEERAKIMAGWGIPFSPLNIADGAGMLRGIGRQVGIAEVTKIKASIESARSKAMGANSMGDLMRLSELMRKDPSQNVRDQLRCFIISSLAGGSGAGMFMDIAEIIKRTYRDEPWAQKSLVSMLYTAEVFEDLKGAGDVKQNCLGAMNEITAGKYNIPTERTNLLMSKLQLSAPGPFHSGIGAQGNLLIGSRNSQNVNLAKDGNGFGMNEVFLTVGETLAGIVSNPSIAEFLYNQVVVNVTARDKNTCTSGLVPTDIVLPFASLGFGRLTIGVDRMIQYVTHALTKRQVADLLYPEMVERTSQNDLPKDKLLAARIDEAYAVFLRRSKLDEKQSSNDITDALKASNLDEVTRKMSSYILQPFGDNQKPVAVPRMAQLTWANWQDCVENDFNEVYDDIRRKASKWSSEVQVEFVELIAEYIASNGLQVAAGLLDKLIDDLKVVVSEADLGREIAQAKNMISRVNADWWRTKVVEKAGARTGLSNQDSPVISELEELIRGYARKREEAWRKSLSKELIEDISENFLVPLAETLREHFIMLKGKVESKNLEENDGINLSTYPVWGQAVPRAYFPRSIERTLIAPEDFPREYVNNAILDVNTSLNFVQPYEDDKGMSVFNLSTGKAILGLPFENKEKKRQDLINFKRWIPRVSLASNEFPQKAEFYLDLSLRNLNMRNESWLLYKGSQINRLASQSIRDFCHANGKASIQNERMTSFAEKYSEMMRISEPLATFNTRALSLMVKDSQGNAPLRMMRKSVKVPFGSSDKVAGNVKLTLTNLDIDTTSDAFANEWFDATSNDSELFAISFTEGPLPGYVFSSLTRPIAESVRGAQRDGVVWSKYFTSRRSRPLQESIPLSHPNLLSAVTGWLVARWFGLLDDQTTLAAGKSQRIWNTTLEVPGWSNFPSPLLDGSQRDSESWLPQILTSLGLAYVNFGEEGDPSHLHPYQHLLYLGKEVTTFHSVDNWSLGGGELLPKGEAGRSELIRNFVMSGESPRIEHALFAQGMSLSSLTPDQRIQILVEYIDRFQANLNQNWDKMKNQPWDNLPHTWELAEEINESVRMIRDYVQGVVLIGNTNMGV